MYRALVSRRAAQALRARRGFPLNARQNSSTSKNATDAAKLAQQKATEALGSAQQIAGKVIEQLSNVAGKVGTGAGNLLGGYRQPLLYKLSVAREFFKQVYVREGLAPPADLATIQNTYQTLFARARDINYWRGVAQSGEWAKVGIYGLEAYFIFHIGEMIGRRHIVGYKVD